MGGWSGLGVDSRAENHGHLTAATPGRVSVVLEDDNHTSRAG